MLLTEKQMEYRRNATHRWNIKSGATRSGKTYADYFLIPKRLRAVSGKPGAAVIMGNTRGTITRNIIDPLRDIYGDKLVGSIRADNTAMLFGERVYCLGADSRKHVNRIRGMSIKYCYGDEITTWNEEVFSMLQSRLDKAYSIFDGTCNPESPQHWAKKFLDSNADIYQQSYTIDDNDFLEPQFVENLKREYAGTVYYDRYILGRWVAAEGAIYRAFADDPARYIIDTAPQIMTAKIGVDFGGGKSAHAFVCVGYTYGYAEKIILDEYCEKSALDPHMLESNFVSFVERCQRTYPVYDVYCDNAERTLINGLRRAADDAHLRVAIRGALKKPINDRIRCDCRLIATDRFKVMRNCTATIAALSSAVWDGAHTTKDVRLDNGTTNIDVLDAQEYATERHIADLLGSGMQRATPTQQIITSLRRR